MASITAVNSNSKMTIFKAQVCLNKENVQIIIFSQIQQWNQILLYAAYILT